MFNKSIFKYNSLINTFIIKNFINKNILKIINSNIFTNNKFNNFNSNNKLFEIQNTFIHTQKNNFTTIDISSSTKTTEIYSNTNYDNHKQTVKNHVNLNATNLNDNKGSRKLKRRVGRGPGSSKGKTSARGHRIRGNPYRHFEGGQTNVFRRLPKHGFRNKKYNDEFSTINIQKILYLIHKGRIDPTKPIGIKELFYSGGVSKVVDGIKLLSRGMEHLKNFPPLNIEVQSATEKAINGIKENGGSITIIHGTKLFNRFIIKPAKFTRQLNEPYPSFKKVRRILRLKDKGAL